MKTNYFYGSIAIIQYDGYTENLEFNAIESKGLTFRYPYGDATPEEAEAISQFVKTITNAYNKLTIQIDNVNKDLKLEKYRPVESLADTTSDAEPESAEVSAVPQPSHGGSDVVDSYKISSTSEETMKEVVITKVTEEDNW